MVEEVPPNGPTRPARKRAADEIGPVPTVVVHPALGVVFLHDQPHRRRRRVGGVEWWFEPGSEVRRWVSAAIRTERVAYSVRWKESTGRCSTAENRRSVAGLEDRRVDVRPVGAYCKRPRIFAIDCDLQRSSHGV